MALGVVMILSAVALALTAGLLYMLARSGYTSGMQRQYKTALEAADGGVGVTFRAIALNGAVSGIGLPTPPTAGANLPAKLSTATSSWGPGVDNSMTIDPSDASTYDLSFDMGAYRVYSKIVDTVPGTTSVDEGLKKDGVVSTTTGELVVMSNPYIYSIEILSQRRANPSERAKLSVLYEY